MSNKKVNDLAVSKIFSLLNEDFVKKTGLDKQYILDTIKKGATDFVTITQSNASDIIDCNTTLTEGIYKGTFTNVPSSIEDGTGVLIVSVYFNSGGTIGKNPMWLKQLFLPVNDNDIYYRSIHSNVIEEWEVISKGYEVIQQLSTENYDLPLLMSKSNIYDETKNIKDVSLRNNSIYANPNNGKLGSKSYTIDNKVSLEYDSINKCLNFNFL